MSPSGLRPLLFCAGLSGSMPLVLSEAAGAGVELDPSFGTGGQVTTTFPGEELIARVAVQSDGKILAAGTATNLDRDFGLARYLPDGTLDSDFGDGGWVTADFGGDDYVHSLAVQSDGRILLTGHSDLIPGFFALARYLPNGSPDPGFGNGGKVTATAIAATTFAPSAMILQSDGRILLAGTAGGFGNSDFALARFTAGGELDSTFGTAGRVSTDFGSLESAKCIAVMNDGRIVVAGEVYPVNSAIRNRHFALARYLSTGVLDATFGNEGLVLTELGSIDDSPTTMRVQSDGKIVLAGYSTSDPSFRLWNMVLARYHEDGRLDETFGTGGIVTIESGGARDAIEDMVLQSDGKILAVGNSLKYTGFDVVLLRVDPDGSRDLSFADGGRRKIYLGTGTVGGSTEMFGIALQSDGKIVLGGIGQPSGSQDFSLARFVVGGLTPQQRWRQTWFGTTENSGTAGNEADPDGDGLVNFVEWAFGTNPGAPGDVPWAVAQNGRKTELTFPRSIDARKGGAAFVVESATSLSGPWTTELYSFSILSDDGTLQQVKATQDFQTSVPLTRVFMRLRVTAP